MQRPAEADSRAGRRPGDLPEGREAIRYRVVHSSGETFLNTLAAARDALQKLPGARVFRVREGDCA